jgi:hypothetical protein
LISNGSAILLERKNHANGRAFAQFTLRLGRAAMPLRDVLYD